MIFASVAAVLWATALLSTAQAHFFSGFRSEERPGDDIEALCSGHRVNLTTFSQLHTLGRRVSQCSDCSESLTGAIHELVTLIEHGKTDLCSVESIESLQSYYAKYLDTSEHGNNGHKHKELLLPKSLRRFVLAYGMQTSNLCKKNMARVLTEQSPGVLSDSQDQELLEQLTGDQGPVAQVLGVLGGGDSPDEIFMSGDLTSLLKRHRIETKELGGDKLFLQTATGPYVRRLQSLCERRYKPVYEPLMLPLVRLANMGFNYRDAPLKRQLDRPKIHRQVSRWSRIVLLCEALANIEIVEVPSGQKHEGLAPVRILTKEEAFAVKRAAKESAPSEDDEVPYLVAVPTSERVLLGDLVYDRANENLQNVVRKFKTNWSVDKNIRKRMIRKGLALAKDQLKQGHFGVVISAAYKGLIRRQSVVTNPSELVVKSLDEMIQRNGTGVENPAKSKMDNFKHVLYEAYVFVVCVAMVVALISSFFLGILV